MKYESIEVPFKLYGNRLVLTEEQLVDCPWLREFVERYRDCFETSFEHDFYIYNPGGIAVSNIADGDDMAAA